MKKYCLDTSGLSNPLEHMPEDIHVTLWHRVADVIQGGHMSATAEIYEELTHINGKIGSCLKSRKDDIMLDVGDGRWDWNSYLAHAKRMAVAHRKFISEYNGNRKGTVGLIDLSIIAMGKAMSLPVVSMENLIKPPIGSCLRIPNVCKLESVEHLTFSEFLRKEKIQI